MREKEERIKSVSYFLPSIYPQDEKYFFKLKLILDWISLRSTFNSYVNLDTKILIQWISLIRIKYLKKLQLQFCQSNSFSFDSFIAK